MQLALETHDLRYRFGSGPDLLKGLNLRVPKGSIYGFLGPNGAGKTTTMRVLIGLLPDYRGKVEILGQSLEDQRLPILKRLGSLIEMPSLYSHLSAKDNLKVWQWVYGCSDNRLPEVLELVGLGHAGGKPAGKFSLGMQQRLGLAVALLHQPPLLVLDEPINGLDPEGIVDIRKMLIHINQAYETTILISSHLLAEMEKLAQVVGIIQQGQLRFEGKMEDLVQRRGRQQLVLFQTSDNAKAAELSLAAGYSPELHENGLTITVLHKEQTGSLIRLWTEGQVDVYEARPLASDLEDIFLTLIQP